MPRRSRALISAWTSQVSTTSCGTYVARLKIVCAKDSSLTASALGDAERCFLEELNARGVRYMIVGLTAAIVQGANTVTRDIDLDSTRD